MAEGKTIYLLLTYDRSEMRLADMERFHDGDKAVKLYGERERDLRPLDFLRLLDSSRALDLERWTAADAQHAAVAVEHGCTMVSTDSDFSRFPTLRTTRPGSGIEDGDGLLLPDVDGPRPLRQLRGCRRRIRARPLRAC